MVQERLDKELIPALLLRAVNFHARKGLRTWCECSFCRAKRIGSVRIGYLGRVGRIEGIHSLGYKPEFPGHTQYWRESGFSEEHVKWTIERRREEGRKTLRIQLESLKTQVL